MGIYINPGNNGFAEIVNGDYIDKTGMIELINKRIGTTDKLVCISRPRRFGKSYAAKMLCAYYDRTCDSHYLFDEKEIAETNGYEEHINQYNVIILDMAQMVEESDGNSPVEYIKEQLNNEIRRKFPEAEIDTSFPNTLVNVVESTGYKFIMIIDEWDTPIRECPAYQSEYLKFLRSLFKSSTTTAKIFAAAYMTGILPIKKDGSESAVSDFNEYTILEPEEFAEYTGFTETEVQHLCEEKQADFSLMKSWYDGYRVGDKEYVYNPYSVMKALGGKYKSYWRKTSAAENLKTYINIDQYGINEEIIKLTAGEKIKVDTSTFNNDLTSFTCKDDVLTLMIHLGYLTYDEETTEAWIPNEEVRLEYRTLVKKPGNSTLADLIMASEKLLDDTLAGREEEVAKAIEHVRETNYAPQHYNNEQALRYAIKFAYIVCVDRFLKIEELPGGRGLADVVFIPKRDTAYPAIIIELKWDKDEEQALGQIDEKKYAAVLEGYTGEVVKVGISYDSNRKIHSCRINKNVRK